MTLSSRNTLRFLGVLGWLLGIVLYAQLAFGGQTQPDAKRVHEIQVALASHGYAAGSTWIQTQTVLRGIAKTNGWQTDHAPDARVLILLGLGSKNSDSQVLEEHNNHLDQRTK